MAELDKQESKKTLVTFVVGLLIGGLLVWAFSSTPDTANAPTKITDTAEVEGVDNTDSKQSAKDVKEITVDGVPVTLSFGDGKIVVDDQPASADIVLKSAEYPVSEGWVGVREYTDEKLGYILGVVRFSESQGLIPESIVLQRPTTAGRQYAVVVFKENGDFKFNLANDGQVDQIFSTFTAK